jgi:hypothetical protein
MMWRKKIRKREVEGLKEFRKTTSKMGSRRERDWEVELD